MKNDKNSKTLKEKLISIREPQPGKGLPLDIAASLLILIFGTALGVFSKYIDGMPYDTTVLWQMIVARLDLGNVLSEMPIWLLMALLIAVFSRSPFKAALNVFLFFGGMCISYHICSVLLKGFDPGNYMLIWYGITLVSPLLGIICWYARGGSLVSVLLDIPILTVMSHYCFSVGPFYFYLHSTLNTLMFLVTVAALYKTPRQILISTAAGILLSILLSQFMVF